MRGAIGLGCNSAWGVAAGRKWLTGQDVFGGGTSDHRESGMTLSFWHKQWDRSLGCLLLRGRYYHDEGGRQGWGKVNPSGHVKLDLRLRQPSRNAN